MSIKRKQHNSNFKAKVALAAIKSDFTVPEICSKYQVSPSAVHKWKKQVLEKMSLIFSDNSRAIKSEDNDKLYAEIGRLKIENNFLLKKLEG